MLDLEALRAWEGTLVVDAMYGAGLDWFSNILQGGSLEVYDLHNERNPLFPNMHNPEPIPGNLQDLFSIVRQMGAQLGLATDGDADRLGACAESGEFLNQLTVMSLLALYLLEVRRSARVDCQDIYLQHHAQPPRRAIQRTCARNAGGL